MSQESDKISISFFGHTFPRGSASEKKKMNELISLPFISFITIYGFYSALLGIMSPLIFTLLFIFHVLLLFFTKFNERKPHFLLILFRHYQSMVSFLMPFLYFMYFLTLITLSASPNGIETATLFAQYAFLLSFWIIFSSIPILGIYFSVSILTHISGDLVQMLPSYFDPPVVLYFTFFFQFLWGLGFWYSNTYLTISLIRGKEDLGNKTEAMKKITWVYLIMNLVLGIVLIIYEPQFLEWISRILLNSSG